MGEAPSRSHTLSLRLGAAEPLRVWALGVSIVAAEQARAPERKKIPSCLWPVPLTRPPAIEERSVAQAHFYGAPLQSPSGS